MRAVPRTFSKLDADEADGKGMGEEQPHSIHKRKSDISVI